MTGPNFNIYTRPDTRCAYHSKTITYTKSPGNNSVGAFRSKTVVGDRGINSSLNPMLPQSAFPYNWGYVSNIQ